MHDTVTCGCCSSTMNTPSNSWESIAVCIICQTYWPSSHTVKMCLQLLRQHAGTLDNAKQQLNAMAAELAQTQQEMTQLQIMQWRPVLAAFDQQLEVTNPSPGEHHLPCTVANHTNVMLFSLQGVYVLTHASTYSSGVHACLCLLSFHTNLARCQGLGC